MANYGLLTLSIICRNTVWHMGEQLRAADNAFQAVRIVPVDTRDLTLTLDCYAERHLREAADTLMNMNWPLSAPPLRKTLSAECSVERHRNIVLRIISHYNITMDQCFLRFDAQYRPETLEDVAESA